MITLNNIITAEAAPRLKLLTRPKYDCIILDSIRPSVPPTIAGVIKSPTVGIKIIIIDVYNLFNLAITI